MSAPPTNAEQALIDHAARVLPRLGERRSAFDAFQAHGLPTRWAEAWKWSDLRAALREAPRFDGAAPDTDAFHGGPLLSERPLAALAGALGATSTFHIEQAPDTAFAFEARAEGDSRFERREVRVAAGVAAVMIDRLSTAGEAFLNQVVHITLEPGARLQRIVLHADGAEGRGVCVATTLVDAEAGAHFEQTTLTTGGRLTRLETAMRYLGEGASAVLDGVYLLNGQRHADLTSHIDHVRPRCETRQLVKGAVSDKATAVFQGKFHVARAAQLTDARMRHDALLLNEGASVNAKPELEIYADDVQCAHGSTAGAIDDDALFYMRQRGLSEAQARAMLVRAFLLEAIERVEEPAAREALEAEIARWLESQS